MRGSFSFLDELNEVSRARRLGLLSFFNGRRRKAWGRYRNPHTTQERRYAEETVFFDFDEETEELNVIPIKFRARKNLPNAWDDIYSHSQKSWKKQSKRARQYRVVDDISTKILKCNEKRTNKIPKGMLRENI